MSWENALCCFLRIIKHLEGQYPIKLVVFEAVLQFEVKSNFFLPHKSALLCYNYCLFTVTFLF